MTRFTPSVKKHTDCYKFSNAGQVISLPGVSCFCPLTIRQHLTTVVQLYCKTPPEILLLQLQMFI